MGFRKVESKFKKIGLIRIVYGLILRAALIWLRLFSLFGTRYGQFFNGRAGLRGLYRQTFSVIPKNRTGPIVWIHCASLGEFEQGRPVLESIREDFPDAFILLTFFSPSGYEVRKNYAVADAVMYLPVDTRSNARWFLDTVNPAIAIFVKYDFWPVLLHEISDRRIPAIAVASVFRKDQIYFRWYGGYFRTALKAFTQFLVQDEDSARLLRSIGIGNVQVAGDTRFDRVLTVKHQAQEWPQVRRFVGDKRVLVMGSTWREDLELLAGFVTKHQETFRFIVVPHHTDESSLQEAERILTVPVRRWSDWEHALPDAEPGPVLLIDKIGMLSGLYRYAHYAWVGGAFGKGLHNTLEPAVYGIPVFFGDRNYLKFHEAVGLIREGGAFAVTDGFALETYIGDLEQFPGRYAHAAQRAGVFVQQNAGATAMVMEFFHKILQR